VQVPYQLGLPQMLGTIEQQHMPHMLVFWHDIFFAHATQQVDLNESNILVEIFHASQIQL
jgi:hypothetical protein